MRAPAHTVGGPCAQELADKASLARAAGPSDRQDPTFGKLASNGDELEIAADERRRWDQANRHGHPFIFPRSHPERNSSSGSPGEGAAMTVAAAMPMPPADG
jgi:hypothetical protein